MKLEIYNKAIESIRGHEGFREMPYRDSRGILTIGSGIKLPITRAEDDLLVRHRADHIFADLEHRLYSNFEIRLEKLPPKVQIALLDMSYELGAKGVMRFKKMLQYIVISEWKKAASEALDSKWARDEAKRRANDLAGLIRNAEEYPR